MVEHVANHRHRLMLMLQSRCLSRLVSITKLSMGAYRVESELEVKEVTKVQRLPPLAGAQVLQRDGSHRHRVANAAPVNGVQVLQRDGSHAHRGGRGPRHFEEGFESWK